MKSKKRWFVTALTACLTLSLGICAEALEYDFDGVEDTEYYPSTSYESLYGAKYNYGGSNATDYPDVVSVKQMCIMLGGISMKTAYKLLGNGEIHHLKIGKSFKIPKICVIEYLLG